MLPKATVSHVVNTANRSHDWINKTTFFFRFDNNEGKQKITKLLNCLHTGLVELLHAMSICENYDICKKKKIGSESFQDRSIFHWSCHLYIARGSEAVVLSITAIIPIKHRLV